MNGEKIRTKKYTHTERIYIDCTWEPKRVNHLAVLSIYEICICHTRGKKRSRSVVPCKFLKTRECTFNFLVSVWHICRCRCSKILTQKTHHFCSFCFIYFDHSFFPFGWLTILHSKICTKSAQPEALLLFSRIDALRWAMTQPNAVRI